MLLLAEKAMHSERCHAHLYTKEVKGICLAMGKALRNCQNQWQTCHLHWGPLILPGTLK